MSYDVQATEEETINPADAPEYAVISTVNGFQSVIHFKHEELLELLEVMKQATAAGVAAFVTLSDIDTGDRYLFPGNVESIRLFSAGRMRQMKREEEQAEAERREAMKLAARGQASQLIVPGQNRAARRA